MSTNDNECNTPISKASTSKKDCVRLRLSDEFLDNSFAAKSGFRGFQRRPVVFLERIDITPYLGNMELAPAQVWVPEIVVAEPLLSVKDFKPVACSVRLQRDDLEALKASLKSRTSHTVNLTCNICFKIYNDEKKLENHLETKHMLVYDFEPKAAKTQKKVSFSDHVIIHEVKEYHKCRKCPKIFETYNAMKRHMKERHKKRKCYICNYCTKSFVDRVFFKVHIKLHCDTCGELFLNKSKLVDHRRTICRVLKLHKCKTCNETFYSYMDLKDHSYEHSDVSFVCDICKDQFETHCATAHHFAFLHSTKRPLSQYAMSKLGYKHLYSCNFCEVSSVEKEVLEEHVELLPDLANKAMTGYTDYYFCDQCLRKFDKESEMLQHKWTHFLKTTNEEESNPNLSDKVNNKNINVGHSHKKCMKRYYNINDVIPAHFHPKVQLTQLKCNTVQPDVEQNVEMDLPNYWNLKKAIVDPKSKKTLLSKHQCQMCDKYFSSNYCLNRHIQTQHCDFENLQCHVCEETFVWPSLLQSHRCIRANIPDDHFDDGRPEIHFDNLGMVYPESLQPECELDDLSFNDDYMECVDFEVPAPIVELTEYPSIANSYPILGNMLTNGHSDVNCDVNSLVSKDKAKGKSSAVTSFVKVVMQEVPIEF